MSTEDTDSNKTPDNSNPPDTKTNNEPVESKTSDKNINNKANIKDLVKIPFVKDLIVKLDVLKNGIITERKKYTDQIKQLQSEMDMKSEIIRNLTNDKLELEKELEDLKKELEKKGNARGFFKMATNLLASQQLSGIFGVKNDANNNNKNVNNNVNENNVNEENNNNNTETENSTSENNEEVKKLNEEIKKLNEEISSLKFENETYLQKMNATLEDNENRRLEYKKTIKNQTENIKSLEEKIKKMKEDNLILQNKINDSNKIYAQSYREREHFENLLKDFKNSKDDAITQLNSCLEKCGRLMAENETYKELIYIHEMDLGKLAQKLDEYKDLLLKVHLRNQIYHVTKIGILNNKEINIIFAQDLKGNYVMKIDEGEKQWMINIQDVEYAKMISKNKVEISYMYNAKKYKITVIVSELIIDQFVNAYKNFYTESINLQNKVSF